MADDVSVYIDADWITIRVDLPEDEIDNGEGNILPEARTRAIEAITCILRSTVSVFIDGEDKEPTRVHIDPWGIESDDVEFRVE